MILTALMAHQRKLIRKAVAALLVAANTAAGARVASTLVDATKQSELPKVVVFTSSEDLDEELSAKSAPRELTRQLELQIVGLVAHSTAVPADDAVDNLAEQIEAAMDADRYITAFLPITAVDPTTDRLTIANHGLSTGAAPAVVASSGAVPGGVDPVTQYHVIVVDPNTIQLALSIDDAMDGTAVDITDAGSGTIRLALSTAVDSILTGTEIEVRDGDRSDPLVGIVTLTYRVTYRTQPAPPLSLADFASIDAKYPMAGSSPTTPVTEDLFDLEES